jgi:ribosome-associated heat shock protein Hsp15
VAEGHVRINGTKTLKPAHPVRRADHLTIVLYGGVRLLEVLDLASRRGGAPAARLLYREPAMRQKEGASPGGTC